MATLPEGRQPAAWGTGEEIAKSERWQSGRMRVFAKDVSGQKLDRGFESRPLRCSIAHSLTMIRGGADASRRGGAEGGGRLLRSCCHAVMLSCGHALFLRS